MKDPQLKQQMSDFGKRKSYGPGDPPKKKKSVPTQKDPNLSPKERKLVYDGNMPESNWKKLVSNAKKTGVSLTDKDINSALRKSQAKDSATIVNERYNHKTFSITGGGGGYGTSGSYKNRGVSHRTEGTSSKEYTKNQYYRNRHTGKLDKLGS